MKSEPQSSATTIRKADFEHLSSFRHQLRRFLRISEDLCRSRGVTPLQYQLLLQVMGAPGRDWSTIGEVADRLQAKHHGVVALIDRCEKLALVHRQVGRSDRRQVEIHLLPKGRQLVEELALLHRPELRELKSVLQAFDES